MASSSKKVVDSLSRHTLFSRMQLVMVLILLIVLSAILAWSLVVLSRINHQSRLLGQAQQYDALNIADINSEIDLLGTTIAQVEGEPGADGPPGLPGQGEEAGVNGSQGIQGASEADGAAGADGVDGIDGVDGVDGIDGATGPKGDKGDTGPAGPPGAVASVTAGAGLANSGTAADPVLDINAGTALGITSDILNVLAADGTVTVAGGVAVSFGIGAGVGADDIPIADAGGHFTSGFVEGALQETVVSVLSGSGTTIGGTAYSPSVSITDNATNGLNFSSGPLTVNTGGAGTGLTLSGDAVSLLTSCAVGEVLKWGGAAWACAADVSSSADYASSYDTGIQTVSAINTWTDITFGTNAALSGITHTAASASFTLGASGTTYYVRYTLQPESVAQKDVSFEGRAVLGGSEISGSAVNGTAHKDPKKNFPMAQGFMFTTTGASQVLKIQMAGNHADTQIEYQGADAGTGPSASVQILEM